MCAVVNTLYTGHRGQVLRSNWMMPNLSIAVQTYNTARRGTNCRANYMGQICRYYSLQNRIKLPYTGCGSVPSDLAVAEAVRVTTLPQTQSLQCFWQLASTKFTATRTDCRCCRHALRLNASCYYYYYSALPLTVPVGLMIVGYGVTCCSYTFIHFIHFFIANKCQNAFAVTYDYNILRLCY